MLEYAKQILPKVCNWKTLFRKELIKSIDWAGPENRDEMFNWCYRNYAELHFDVLKEVFPGEMEKPTRLNQLKKSPATMSKTVYNNLNLVNSRSKRLKKEHEIYK
jgi:light-regulated signal transduction histidine kinase (bacteriophytochrome)